MGHLTRCCVAVMFVCEIVAALEDSYILLTKRLNKIERNVNENFEDFRAEMTTMLDIIKGINSSVFDLKEMFLNKTTNDSYAKHTEPANAMHLMSIRNGFRAEKKARVQLTYDLDRILLSLQEHNSAVDAKLRNLERNLTDVFRTMAANRMSFTQMQENFESKQKSVEDSVRKLTAGFSSTYVRWGRTSCSGSYSELVYKGYTGGSTSTDTGSAADFLCLPENPSWAKYQNVSIGCGSVFGSAYYTNEPLFWLRQPKRYTVPCCMCKVPRTIIIMIPGRTNCYQGWTMEYTGSLMSRASGDAGATNYVCVDENLEIGNLEGVTVSYYPMCFVQAICGNLPCPPYIDRRQLACVVCST